MLRVLLQDLFGGLQAALVLLVLIMANNGTEEVCLSRTECLRHRVGIAGLWVRGRDVEAATDTERGSVDNAIKSQGIGGEVVLGGTRRVAALMVCGFELGLRRVEDAEAAVLWWVVLGMKPWLQMQMWAIGGRESLRLSALIRQPAYLAEDTNARFVTSCGVVVRSTVVLHLVCRWRDWIGVGWQAWQDRATCPTI